MSYRLPSYGIFMAAALPHYWFGIARSVSFPGVVMDVDRITIHAEAKDADNQKRIAYIRQIGSAASAFEHAVPERLFADPTKPVTDPSQPQGISAVKALAIAASQGQKIYTLNDKNTAYHTSIVASLGTDADTKAEISNALYAGMEVTVHQSDINAYGWTGMGYMILDPDSGAGAYKISGGANGGFLDTWSEGLGTGVGMALAFASLLGALHLALTGLALAPVLLVLLVVLSVFVSFMNYLVIEIQTFGCSGIGSLGAFLEGLALILSFLGAGGVALGTWISFLTGGTISGVSNLAQCKGQ